MNTKPARLDQPDHHSWTNTGGASPNLPSLNRRAFLSRTLGVASAAPWIAMTAAEPAAEAPAKPAQPDRKVKLGVIGNGGRGCWIANLFRRHGGYEMWAVGDYFQQVADACSIA